MSKVYPRVVVKRHGPGWLVSITRCKSSQPKPYLLVEGWEYALKRALRLATSIKESYTK